MKKRNYLLAAMLFVMVGILAFSPPAVKADSHSGQCSYIGMWGGGAETGCMPFYNCPNPNAWPFSDRCYHHMGVPDVPNPCN